MTSEEGHQSSDSDGGAGIRDLMRRKIESRFGKPTPKKLSAGTVTNEWWIQPLEQTNAVHVCLNEPANQRQAHVIVFDPRAVEGKSVVEVIVDNEQQADAFIQRLERIARGGSD